MVATMYGLAAPLNPTPLKTSAYSAVAGDYVPVSTATGAVTVTLPGAPANTMMVGVKLVTQGSGNIVTINASGSDVFNVASGATSITLTAAGEAVLLVYASAAAIWYVIELGPGGLIVPGSLPGGFTGNPTVVVGAPKNTADDVFAIVDDASNARSGSANMFIVRDHNNSPIAAVAAAGGFKVFSDKVGSWDGVSNLGAQLVPWHAVQTGGSSGPTIYGGAGAPLPAAIVTALGTYTQVANVGDFYIQTDGTSTGILWQCTVAGTGGSRGGTWAKITNNLDVLGNGSDGAVTLDGVTTYNGFSSLGGSTYTLTRDVMATSLTINNGVTLAPAGFRIFCTGVLTVNTGGIISAAGNPGAANGNAGAATGTGTLGSGKIGGAGATGVGNNGTNSGFGGGGGGGGTATSAGGTGGTSATNSPATYLNTPYPTLTGLVNVGGSTQVGGSPSGGGGGGDGTHKGGGGGGGGGMVAIFAANVLNSGTITAAGGNGGTPGTANAGGGGGGGGGTIIVYTLVAWTAGTTNVAGGAFGTGAGTGANGVAGSSGAVQNVVLA